MVHLVAYTGVLGLGQCVGAIFVTGAMTMGCACHTRVLSGHHGHRCARCRALGVQLVPLGGAHEREESVEVVPVVGQLAIEHQRGLPASKPRLRPSLVSVDLAPHVSERG